MITEGEFEKMLNGMTPDERTATIALNPHLFKANTQPSMNPVQLSTAVSHPKQPSDLEVRLSQILDRLSQELDLPAFEQEYRFNPDRRWAFDFALPDIKIAIEAEGGGWMTTKEGHGKGHLHPKRFERDCEKYNTATADGWQVYRFTGAMIKDGRAEAFLRSIFPPF